MPVERARAHALAHIIPEVHSSGKNEILRTTLLHPRRVSSALVIVRRVWRYVESTHDDYTQLYNRPIKLLIVLLHRIKR